MADLQPLEFRRILVPVDESRPSQNSLAVAAGLARASGATVLLAHVIEMPLGSQDEYNIRATYGAIVDDYRKSGEEVIKRTAGSETFTGLEVETRLVFGEPARALLEIAGGENIDVIVMGSHGRGALGRMVLGSVSQRVIHDATVPVIIVPPRLEQAVEIPEASGTG